MENPTYPKEPKDFENESNFLDISGFVTTLTEEPNTTAGTGAVVPGKLSTQIFIVKTGGSTALFVYDIKNLTWLKTALT